MKRTLSLAVPLMCLLALPALARDRGANYPAAVAQRPLVLDAGMLQAGLGVDVGLNKGRTAKDLGVTLDFGWAVIDDLEIGLDMVAMRYAKDAFDTKFGGVDLYGRYRFLDMLAAELRVYTPGDRTYLDSFGDQMLGVMAGLPFQWIAVQNILKVHAGLFADVGFVKDTYPTSGGQSPQFALALDYGVTVNPIRALFVDLSFGTRLGFRPDAGSFGDRVRVPAELAIGGTLLRNRLDLFAGFSITDLNPAAGGTFDGKAASIGGRFRF